MYRPVLSFFRLSAYYLHGCLTASVVVWSDLMLNAMQMTYYIYRSRITSSQPLEPKN